ncbi:MAG: hypothetical protein ACFE0J_05120 [Elainellaceae cyanobacterium]
MNNTKHNIERLAILNAWVTSVIVLLNLMTGYLVLNVRTFESFTLVIFVSGTVGGAASNYRRLQEAYVQQLGKSRHSIQPPTQLQENQPPENQPPENQSPENQSPENQPPESQPLNSERPSTPEDPSDAKGILSEPSDPKSLAMKDEATILLLRLQIFLSPVFGGLFAFVLYGVFASGIIQGEIFPRFQSADSEYTTPYEFADQTIPATNGDAAKAILWGFIAGFAEGFVPNFIDKLVKDAEQENS